MLLVLPITLFVGCNEKRAESFIAEGVIELYTEKELDLSQVIEKEYTVTTEQTDVLEIYDGKTIFAKKLGKATIEVETDKKTYYQEIEVLDGGVRPEIRVEDIGLIVGASYTFDPATVYKLKEVEGVTYSYSVSDASVAEISNGKITAKKLGQTTVTITAQYKGVDQYAQKTINCSVNTLSGIDVKGKYEMFIREDVDGHSFNVTEALEAEVYVDGNKIDDATVTWTVADTTIADIKDGAEGKYLSSVKVGETTVKAVYDDGNGTVLSTKDLVVEVKIPIVKAGKDQLVDLGKQVQLFDSADVFEDGSQKISCMEIESKEYAVADNSIATDGLKAGEYKCIFYNTDKTYGYEMQLVVADFVVYEPSQLIYIVDHQNEYIAIGNDIDYGTFIDDRSHIQSRHQQKGRYVSPQRTITDEQEPIASQPMLDFNGTLNGLGHVITNIEMYATGLFPRLGNGTIKNLAMTNVRLTDYNACCLAYSVYGKAVVDNVYLEVTSSSTEFQSGMFELIGKGGKATIKNSIVRLSLSEATKDNENARKNIGVVTSRHEGAAFIENCYFFSEYTPIAGTIVKDQDNVNCGLLNKLNCLFRNDEEFFLEFNREDNIIDYSGFNYYWTLDYITGKVPMFNSVG